MTTSRERTSAPVSQLDAGEPAPLTQPGLLQPGETLALGSESTRYEIVRPLGKGGMAEVYLARRLGPAGFVREVALKCIRAYMDADEGTRRAFLYEAKLASRLRHPNIADAYDLAQLGNRFYLVLEYVDGVTAKEVLQAARGEARPLSEGFCCHVVASVAEGLHHAHALAGDDGDPLGIVHRDVTASNVMIARSGAVKLLDFGIAYARLEGRERTRTGTLKGTYVYLSPEQASAEDVDGRSDLFSLGVLLVEMLTGKRVFDTGSDVTTLRRIADCSSDDVKVATAGLPEALAAICVKALARNPADRFQTGAELSRALRGYLAENGTSYWPSDCVEELGGLGLLAQQRPAPPESVTPPSAETVASPPDPVALAVAEIAAAPGSSPRRGRAVIAIGLALVAVAIWGGMKLLAAGSGSPQTGASGGLAAATPAAVMAQPPPGSERPVPASAPPRREPAVEVDPASLVRPKKSGPGGQRRVAKDPAVAHALTVAAKNRPAEFADRPTVSAPSATLPKGTLIPVKLVRAVAPAKPGDAEALVTEEVIADGVILVPKGSTVLCSSRAAADGRVPLSCDVIRAPGRTLAFRGVAVGEGQHVGLRYLDDEVAAGTSFVVYVSASAEVR